MAETSKIFQEAIEQMRDKERIKILNDYVMKDPRVVEIKKKLQK